MKRGMKHGYETREEIGYETRGRGGYETRRLKKPAPNSIQLQVQN